MRRSCDGWMDGRGGISGMLVELEVILGFWRWMGEGWWEGGAFES